MSDVQTRAKTLFSQVFPERQVYHRSGGSVSYISITPWQQAAAAGGLAIAAGWCVFATVNTLAQGPKLNARADQLDRVEAKHERWASQMRAQATTATALLEERTEAFDRATIEFERRHETLKLLLTSLKEPKSIEEMSLTGNNADLLVTASIDEATPRQARPTPASATSIDVGGFRAQINRIRDEQRAFLDEAEDIAVARSEEARGVLRLTGVGIGRFEEQRELGGPLVEIASLGAANALTEEEAEFAMRVSQVAARMEEASYYQTVVEALPLGEPVGVPFRETSGYGLRNDPFTRRPAFHAGMDMAAYRRAPIVTAGPGKVTYAGNRSGYGRLVEVDHGYGFKTRYGHLQTIDVKKGDVVTMGDKVGSMGSTGRSTGPHLHYEVWFRGKTYNPVEFLRAGKHVHKG